MAESNRQDERLRSAVASHLRSAIGYDNDELSSERAKAWQYYEGDLDVQPAPAGRSAVMSRDVLETVEGVMPSLVRVFLGTDQVIRFEAENPEDEDAAQQATDYIGWLMRRGDTFRQIHDWMKSALIYKFGAIKVYWEEREKVVSEEYTGLTEDEMVAVVEDEAVEVVEQEERVETFDSETGPVPVTLYDLKVERAETCGEIVVEAIPPEEFLTNRRAKSLHDAMFVAHRTRKSRAELLDMGYDAAKIDRLKPADDDMSEEAEERFDDLDYDNNHDVEDEASKLFWIYECFLNFDHDDDGRAERRRVVIGNGADDPVVLENDETDHLPFAGISPVLLPHRLMGLSMDDLSRETQRWKTALVRIMMDGLYHSTLPRLLVDMSQFNTDYMGDLLNQAPGGIVRANGPGAVQPLTTTWEGQRAFPMLEYVDGLLVRRTGVMPTGPDLHPDTLQPETAAKVAEDGNKARERTELIARVFAETGFKDLARLMLRLVAKHQDKERIIKLRNKWVPMDPRGWNIDMDVTVNVGLGTGNRDQQMQRYMVIAQKQEQILQIAGPQNPLVGLKNLFNTYQKMVEAADLQDVDIYFTDPDQYQAPPQEPKPDPKMIEMQAKMQMEQQKAANEAQMTREKAEAELTLKREEMAAKIQLEREKAQMAQSAAMEKAQLEQQLAIQKLAVDQQMRERELQFEAQLEQMKMAAGSRDGQGDINVSGP